MWTTHISKTFVVPNPSFSAVTTKKTRKKSYISAQTTKLTQVQTTVAAFSKVCTKNHLSFGNVTPKHLQWLPGGIINMDFGTGGNSRLWGACSQVFVHTTNEKHVSHSRVMCSQAGEAGELFQARAFYFWGVLYYCCPTPSLTPFSPALLGLSCGCTGSETSLTRSEMGDELDCLYLGDLSILSLFYPFLLC